MLYSCRFEGTNTFQNGIIQIERKVAEQVNS